MEHETFVTHGIECFEGSSAAFAWDLPLSQDIVAKCCRRGVLGCSLAHDLCQLIVEGPKCSGDVLFIRQQYLLEWAQGTVSP